MCNVAVWLANPRSCLFILPCLLALAGGCGGPSQLMPTPNIYARGFAEPFENLPPELQTNTVDVLYMTDRKALAESKPDRAAYGVKRSRSVAYGLATVQIGKDLSWADLQAASKTGKRKVKLPMTIARTVEVGRFPDTPKSLIESDADSPIAETAGTRPTTIKVERDEQIVRSEALLSAQLARAGQGRPDLRPRQQQPVLRRGDNGRATVALHGSAWRPDRVHLARGTDGAVARVHLRPRIERVHRLPPQADDPGGRAQPGREED